MKTKTILMILVTSLLIAACSPAIETPIIEPTEEEVVATTEPEPTEEQEEQEMKEGYIKSSQERETSPYIDAGLVQSLANENTKFALAFYEYIKGKDGNIIFSPLSLSLALSMTMAGAETFTEQAMLDGLQLSLTEEEVHQAFNALLLQIEDSQNVTTDFPEGSYFQMNIANSIWGQAGYAFEEDYLDTLARFYGAGIFSVNFQENPEAAREAINQWVEEETEEKIQDLIPEGAIDTLTRLVLANAIYFNGSWLHPFETSNTSQQPFTLLDGSEISVDMMKLFDERLAYARGENFQAVRLPYLSQDFAMNILLPDENAYSGFETGLTSETLSEIQKNMMVERVDLQMPKFDFETTVNGNDPLSQLGMSEAFDPQIADFSGINHSDDLYITDVLHKATITVDEAGTEAAAATAVIVGITSIEPGEPISLVIDRPFLFTIEHVPTGTILFMGRGLQP